MFQAPIYSCRLILQLTCLTHKSLLLLIIIINKVLIKVTLNKVIAGALYILTNAPISANYQYQCLVRPLLRILINCYNDLENNKKTVTHTR